MDLGLQGKTVLITGGSKGIGLACADVFAAEGCQVHIAARNAQQLEAAQAQIQARHGVRITTHAVDLRDGAALKALATRCATADILVNNAGDIPGGTLQALDEEKWRHAWELKVFGFINLSREMFGHMKSQPGQASELRIPLRRHRQRRAGGIHQGPGQGLARTRHPLPGRASALDPHRSHHQHDEDPGQDPLR
jgi:NAD(P)-dependent dehydrogenase (short-subunit alcohol dehydrogenase family)